MRPRTPFIAKASQSHKGNKPGGPPWAPAMEAPSLQPDFSLKCGKAWHAIPVPPCHTLDEESPSSVLSPERQKDGGRLDALQDLFNSITAVPERALLLEITHKLAQLSAQEAADVLCTAAVQRSGIVRHACGLICKAEPQYAELVIPMFQRQFERRRCKDEIPQHYTLNCIDFMVRLCALDVVGEQVILAMGEALVSDILLEGQLKDQPLNEMELAGPSECVVRLLASVSTLLPERRQLAASLEKVIQGALGMLPLYQLQEQVSRAKAHSSLERPAALAAATVAVAACAAIAAAAAAEADPSFPTSLKAFPFFPFDALSSMDPPQDCISKISGLLSLTSNNWAEDGFLWATGHKDAESTGTAGAPAPPSPLFWANGMGHLALGRDSGAADSPLLLEDEELVGCEDLLQRAEKSRQVIDALRAENKHLRQVAEEKHKEERMWQIEKARLQKEISFQRGSLRVLRDVNASLTQEVAELKLLGNRLLKEVKQKIINGYVPNNGRAAASELVTPS